MVPHTDQYNASFFLRQRVAWWSVRCVDGSVVAADELCTSTMSEFLVDGRRQGYLSPVPLDQLGSRLVAMQSASSGVKSSRVMAGSVDCPWTVSVEQGQRVNVNVTVLSVNQRHTVTVLSARTTLSSRRTAFTDADDDVIDRSVYFRSRDCYTVCRKAAPNLACCDFDINSSFASSSHRTERPPLFTTGDAESVVGR